MDNDLISKRTTIKMLREYADQKCVRGEVELANGILKAVCYIENGNIPAANSDDGWIYCGDGKNLPKEHDSIFSKLKGTDKWDDAMFEKSSNTVIVTAENKNGKRITITARTNDGKWSVDSVANVKVIAWQPFPEPYHDTFEGGSSMKKRKWMKAEGMDECKGIFEAITENGCDDQAAAMQEVIKSDEQSTETAAGEDHKSSKKDRK